MAKIRDIFRWGIPTAGALYGGYRGVKKAIDLHAKKAPPDAKYQAKLDKKLIKEGEVWRKQGSIFGGSPLLGGAIGDLGPYSYPGNDPRFGYLTPEEIEAGGGEEAMAPALLLKQKIVGGHLDSTYDESMNEAERLVNEHHNNAINLQQRIGKRHAAQQRRVGRLAAQLNSDVPLERRQALINNPWGESNIPQTPNFNPILAPPEPEEHLGVATQAYGGSVPRYAGGGASYDMQDFFNNYEGGLLGRRWRYKDLSNIGSLVGLPGWRESHQGDYGESWRDVADNMLGSFGLSEDAKQNLYSGLGQFGQYLNKDNKITRGMERLGHDVPQWLDQHAERHTPSGAALHGTGQYMKELFKNWTPPAHNNPIYDTRPIDADPATDPKTYAPAAGEYKGLASTALDAVDRLATKARNYIFPPKRKPAPTQMSPDTEKEFHVAAPGFDRESPFFSGENTKHVDLKDIIRGKKNAAGLLNQYTAQLKGGEDAQANPLANFPENKLGLNNPLLIPGNPWGDKIQQRLSFTPEEERAYRERIAIKNPAPNGSVADAWNDELMRQLNTNNFGDRIKWAPEATSGKTRKDATGVKFPILPPEGKLKFSKGANDKEGNIYPTTAARELSERYPSKYPTPYDVPKPKIKDLQGYKPGAKIEYNPETFAGQNQYWAAGPEAPPQPYQAGEVNANPTFEPDYKAVQDWMKRQHLIRRRDGAIHPLTNTAPEGYEEYKKIKDSLGGNNIASNYNQLYKKYTVKGDAARSVSGLDRGVAYGEQQLRNLNAAYNNAPVSERDAITERINNFKRDINTLKQIKQEIGTTAEDKRPGYKGWERYDALAKADAFEQKYNPRTSDGETYFNDPTQPEIPRYNKFGTTDSGIFNKSGAHFEEGQPEAGAMNPIYTPNTNVPAPPGIEPPAPIRRSANTILPKGRSATAASDTSYLRDIRDIVDNGGTIRSGAGPREISGAQYARMMDKGINKTLDDTRLKSIEKSKGRVSPYYFNSINDYKQAYGIPENVLPTRELQEQRQNDAARAIATNDAEIERRQGRLRELNILRSQISPDHPQFQGLLSNIRHHENAINSLYDNAPPEENIPDFPNIGLRRDPDNKPLPSDVGIFSGMGRYRAPGVGGVVPVARNAPKTTNIKDPITGRRILGSGVPAINQVMKNLRPVPIGDRRWREGQVYDTNTGEPNQDIPENGPLDFTQVPITQGTGTTLYGRMGKYNADSQFPYESRFRPNSNVPQAEDRFALDRFKAKQMVGDQPKYLQANGTQNPERERIDNGIYSGSRQLGLSPMQQWQKAHQNPGDYDPINSKYSTLPSGTELDMTDKGDQSLAAANARVTTVQPTPSWKSWNRSQAGTPMFGQGQFSAVTNPFGPSSANSPNRPPPQPMNRQQAAVQNQANLNISNAGLQHQMDNPDYYANRPNDNQAQIQPQVQQQQAPSFGDVGTSWGNTQYAYGGTHPRYSCGGSVEPGSVVPVHGVRMPSYEYGGYAEQVQQQMMQQQQQEQMQQQQQQQAMMQQQMMQQQMMQQQMMQQQGGGVMTPNGTYDPTGQMQMPQQPQQPGGEDPNQQQGGGAGGVMPQIKSRVPYYQQMWQKMAQKAAMPKGAVRNVTGLKRVGK